MKRSTILSVLFTIGFVLICCPHTSAQEYKVIYDKYIRQKELDFTLVGKFKEEQEAASYNHVSLHSAQVEQLRQLIKDHHQGKVKTVFLIPQDTTDLAKVFELLSQFPNLEMLNFYEEGYPNPPKKTYHLPDELLKLRNLKFISIRATKALDIEDTFKKLKGCTKLIGVDLTGYDQDIPANTSLPGQILIVKLTIPQLLQLDTRKSEWRMAKIETGYKEFIRDGTALNKLASLNTLELLDFQGYIQTEDAFTKFDKLTELSISAVMEPGAMLLKSLMPLKQLKSLNLYRYNDTLQCMTELGQFKNLELLSLEGTSRFKRHPEELMSIAKLTKLRKLYIQNCIIPTWPDFFKPLTNMEEVVIKSTTGSYYENIESAKLPIGLYELPHLQKLTISNSISEIPPLNKLISLQYLNLTANTIKVVPAGLGGLKNLRSLILARNQLTDVQSPVWVELKKISFVDLSFNKITAFPEGVQHLHRLEFLNLANNKITDFPILDNGKYGLKVLAIDNNLIKALPSNFGNYRLLTNLAAGYNQLNGLPESLGNLARLKYLNLENNHIKKLPIGLANNTVLRDIILKNNTDMDENNIHKVVFSKPKKPFLRADLSNIGLKSLPADAPWQQMQMVLDLTGNQLSTLPIEMSRMKWFYMKLRNNPLKIDTGFIEKEVSGNADAKILFQELGYKVPWLKVTDNEMSIAMSKTVAFISRLGSFDKAVTYAEKAKAFNQKLYKENIYWLAIGRARYETKDYKGAIEDLNNFMIAQPRRMRGGSNARETEALISASYRALGEEVKAAETHALFGSKWENRESSLDAALSYLELGELALSKRYFDSAVVQYRREFESYPSLDLYNYTEVLLMADNPDEALKAIKLYKESKPRYMEKYMNYLETAALIMINHADFEKLKKDYITKIAQTGKMTTWNYTDFNRYLKYSKRSEKKKQQLYELERLNN
ncbi:Leucine-rich repeat (LRR) protein/tetratricopeptide (TPR) repeat protein [Pedobacter sp. UYP24]